MWNHIRAVDVKPLLTSDYRTDSEGHKITLITRPLRYDSLTAVPFITISKIIVLSPILK